MKRRSLVKGAVLGSLGMTSAARVVYAVVTPNLTEVTATTLSGGETVLNKSSINALQTALSGQLTAD